MNSPEKPIGKKAPKAKARTHTSPRAKSRHAVSGFGRWGTRLASQRDAEGIDPFYTHPELACAYAGAAAERWPDPDTLFVEPAAGAGAFVRPLREAGRKVRAMDIAPRGKGIIQGDFFKPHRLFRGRHAGIVVLGNPPFGRNASLAAQFFNRAAEDADGIAFIVPRTFRKMSLQARLDPLFHLAADEDVPEEAFLLDGQAYDVPCAWQVWERGDNERTMPEPPSVDHLIQYTSPALADFAMRRVGFYAGRVIERNITRLSKTTHYFLRELRNGVKDLLAGIDWLGVTDQTAGVRSLSKREIAFKIGSLDHA